MRAALRAAAERPAEPFVRIALRAAAERAAADRRAAARLAWRKSARRDTVRRGSRFRTRDTAPGGDRFDCRVCHREMRRIRR